MTTRKRLRELKVLEGPFQPVDFSAIGDSPQQLFLEWLDTAIATGVAEPHAMVLSTIDTEGHPDARVLILKNVDERGWHFAVNAVSPKGRQIKANPFVALTFYWQKLGRQVRIRGKVVALDAAECAQDFLARSADARANALLGHQSQPLDAQQSVANAITEARTRIAIDPDQISSVWQVYVVAPEAVEFWQGASDRLHKRVIFRWNAAEMDWNKELLWP